MESLKKKSNRNPAYKKSLKSTKKSKVESHTDRLE
jgi:hypothetical protein